MTTPLDPIARLAKAAHNRTTRTERLYTVTRALLERLERVCQVGDVAKVDGFSLRLVRIRSNVGRTNFWDFSDDRGIGCQLDYTLNGDGYLHGDFRAPLRGPNRGDLIAFGQRADRFVAELTAKLEAQAAEALEALEEFDGELVAVAPATE